MLGTFSGALTHRWQVWGFMAGVLLVVLAIAAFFVNEAWNANQKGERRTGAILVSIALLVSMDLFAFFRFATDSRVKLFAENSPTASALAASPRLLDPDSSAVPPIIRVTRNSGPCTPNNKTEIHNISMLGGGLKGTGLDVQDVCGGDFSDTEVSNTTKTGVSIHDSTDITAKRMRISHIGDQANKGSTGKK